MPERCPDGREVTEVGGRKGQRDNEVAEWVGALHQPEERKMGEPGPRSKLTFLFGGGRTLLLHRIQFLAVEELEETEKKDLGISSTSRLDSFSAPFRVSRMSIIQIVREFHPCLSLTWPVPSRLALTVCAIQEVGLARLLGRT